MNIRLKSYKSGECTNLGRPDMLFGTSGVKFLRTASNMAGRKGRPVSTASFFKFELVGMSKSQTNSENAVNVGKPT